MLSDENLEMLHFWLSEEGRQVLAVIDQHSHQLGIEVCLHPLDSSAKILSYLEYESVLRLLQQIRTSQILHVLDLGCGNGWEAFSLAFLLHPARVVGISNDPDRIQAWDSGSITVGAIRDTLPRLVRDIEKTLPWIDNSTGMRDKLDGLRSVMETICNHSLEFMRHDIQNPTWLESVSPFDFVFSKSSFYHTQDRELALRNIRDSMSETGAYLLVEPSITVDGEPDLTPDWLNKAAIRHLGFADCQILESSESWVAALLKR